MEKHREPWEAISLIAAAYLGVFMMHCVCVFLEYTMIVINHDEFNLRDCIEVPLLL